MIQCGRPLREHGGMHNAGALDNDLRAERGEGAWEGTGLRVLDLEGVHVIPCEASANIHPGDLASEHWMEMMKI